MRVLFIVNPRAGRGAGLRVWQRVGGLVARRPGVDAVVAAGPAETRAAAADAVRAGIERVVVVGGDGTLAAVAGELAHSATALGVVPAGTGNDFCRNTGIPRRIEPALDIALRARIASMDLGQASGQHTFLNAAGLGFDAEVAAAAARYPRGLGGTFPYLLGALSTLVWYKPVHVELTVDDQAFAGPVVLIAIANGRFYGGGMQIAPGARADDGRLDVCIAGDLSRGELLRLLGKVYSGSHIGHPKVRLLRGECVRLQVAGEVRAHCDGEPLRAERLEFQVRRAALRVAMPPLART